MNKKVSIIVTCYNKEPYIEQCLNSVLAQTYENWEIVFWDDNSTDNSFRVFTDWWKLVGFDKRVICKGPDGLWKDPMHAKVPLGIVRWAAAHDALGDYIAILDADDYWHPEKLEKQMAVFKQHYFIKLVFSDCHYVGKKYFAPSPASLGIVEERTFHDNYPPLMQDPFIGLLTRYNFIPACTQVYEKEALLDAVRSPSHYTGVEDYDWLLKVTAKYKCDYISEPLAFYRLGGALASTAKNTAQEIDCIKQNINNRFLTRKERRKVRRHVWFTYLKLLYKEFTEGGKG